MSWLGDFGSVNGGSNPPGPIELMETCSSLLVNPADERLVSSRLKTDRARKHLAELRGKLEAFFATDPYKIAATRDSVSRRPTYYVESVRDTPIAVSVVAGDVLHELKCALDHLAYQLYLVGSGRSSGARHVYFPVSDDAARYKSESRRKTEGMKRQAIAALAELEPYEGGKGSILWRLHRLNNIDKHRLLITAGSAYRAVDISHTFKALAPEVSFPSVFLKPESRLCPLKAGDRLFTDLPDAEISQMRFAFEIAFSEPHVAEGLALTDTLHEMVDAVGAVLANFVKHLE